MAPRIFKIINNTFGARVKTFDMKKFFVLLFVVMVITSCTSYSTIRKTATSQPVETGVITAVLADLEVSPSKVTYYYVPTTAIHLEGVKNILNSAIREALAANGDADVLVGMEYEVKYKRQFMSVVVEHIVITGYPAKYKNFRTPSDDKIIELHKGVKSDLSSSTTLFIN